MLSAYIKAFKTLRNKFLKYYNRLKLVSFTLCIKIIFKERYSACKAAWSRKSLVFVSISLNPFCHVIPLHIRLYQIYKPAFFLLSSSLAVLNETLFV